MSIREFPVAYIPDGLEAAPNYKGYPGASGVYLEAGASWSTYTDCSVCIVNHTGFAVAVLEVYTHHGGQSVAPVVLDSQGQNSYPEPKVPVAAGGNVYRTDWIDVAPPGCVSLGCFTFDSSGAGIHGVQFGIALKRYDNSETLFFGGGREGPASRYHPAHISYELNAKGSLATWTKAKDRRKASDKITADFYVGYSNTQLVFNIR